VAANEATSATTRTHPVATAFESKTQAIEPISADGNKETKEKARRVRSAGKRVMWLTSRDVEVVRWVYDARVTTREQIQRLFFTVGGRTRCQHRLSLLLKHRYLDRLESRPASTPDVYLVSRRSFRGVRLLRASGLDDPLNLQAIAPERLQHTLDIISCRVQFLLAGRVPGFAFAEWRQEEELRAVMGNFGIVPDAYVQLTRQSDGGEKRLAFFIEVERSDKSERLLKEKFRRYGAFYYGGDYERLFGTKALRDPGGASRCKADAPLSRGAGQLHAVCAPVGVSQGNCKRSLPGGYVDGAWARDSPLPVAGT